MGLKIESEKELEGERGRHPKIRSKIQDVGDLRLNLFSLAKALT